jgi:hypothetical protein
MSDQGDHRHRCDRGLHGRSHGQRRGSYNLGKTLRDYEQEVVQDAGSRYAPWGPALLRDPNTRADLEYLLDEGRLNLYKETYTLLVALDSEEEKSR